MHRVINTEKPKLILQFNEANFDIIYKSKIKSNDLIRGFIYKPIISEKKIDLDVQEKLFSIFEPQIKRLEVMLNKDLNCWRLKDY